MAKGWLSSLEKVDDYRWRLPVSYKPGMRVPGLIYADERLLKTMAEDQAVEQVANVAFLPGVVGYSLAMPDIHWGYGFPIGGVAAMRLNGGVVSPGGVGFDINCGARLLRTDLTEAEVRPVLDRLADQLFRDVPSGLGAHGPLRVSNKELDEIMVRGAAWMLDRGYGMPDDLDATESRGCLAGADPSTVSQHARERGQRAARHAGRRQPLPGDRSRSRRSTTKRRRAPSAWRSAAWSSSSTAGRAASGTRSARTTWR